MSENQGSHFEKAMQEEAKTPSPKGPDQRKRGPVKRWFIAGITVLSVAAFVIGIAVGYHFLDRQASSPSEPSTATASSEPAAATTWTCSMHPQIKLPKPGKCPICFMDLIPLTDEGGDEDSPRQLKMSPRAIGLAEIQTEPVRRGYATKDVEFVGKVDYDETRVANITAWTPGRLDRLFVDFTGIAVRKGDHLVLMYSPDLIVAQRELIQAWNAHNRPGATNRELTESLLKSAEEKLRLLGVTDEQIEAIKRLGQPQDQLTIYAPMGGIVIEKLANEGMYVQTGTKIYTIADLSQVWLYLDAYESDIPWLRYGQKVEFTTESHPGEIFEGRIAFIDPMLDKKTRTVRVRVNVPNPDGKLKPGMFVDATVRSKLAADNKVFDPTLVGKWISPMHPEVIKDKPGKCDICGMDLVPAEELGYEVPKKAPDVPLLIPATAPLITGKRAVVYVKLPDKEQPTFEGREIILGERAGDNYVVRYGLKEGEQVVTKGNFKIDSALQIKAKPSMMNPEEEVTSTEELASEDHDKKKKQELIVPTKFRKQLNTLYQTYLDAAAAMSVNQASKADQLLAKIPDAVTEVDAGSLDEKAQKLWDQISSKILFAAYEIEDSKQPEDFQVHFSELSGAILKLASTFGQALPETLYRMHCPMALDAKGADWLQATKKVHNPYYGLAMQDCGEVVATYESLAPLEVPNTFRHQLTPLYNAYLEVQVALADDKLPEAKTALERFQTAMKQPEANLLKGRTLDVWKELLAKLAQALEGDWKSEDIEKIRVRFEPIANAMLAVADGFGHLGSVEYYQTFCPMAFKNRGAVWLQAGKQIANPYFGHKMLRCGEIQRDFPPEQVNHSEQKQQEPGKDAGNAQ